MKNMKDIIHDTIWDRARYHQWFHMTQESMSRDVYRRMVENIASDVEQQITFNIHDINNLMRKQITDEKY